MILGIDPGLANLGWAVIESVNGNEYKLVECGCVTSKKTENTGKRLNGIYKELEKIIKKFKIEAVAIETLFFAKNVRSAMAVAEVIGTIKVCGERNKLEVFGYTPLQVKMSLVGYGRADKDQVETMVRTLLGLEKTISPSHASDAVAVALTHEFTSQELKI
jgi:crossover junction endodeoxyribonuclease RuvC